MKQIIWGMLVLLVVSHTGAAQTKKNKPTKGKQPVTQTIDQSKKGYVIIETSLGNITIALNDSAAPKHSANFRKLAKEGFYEGTTFHRVIPGFMIQGGDPNSKDDDRSNDGMGGPPYRIDAEIGLTHDRGVIAAARQSDVVNPKRESNGSQFYITVAEAKFLDGQYSVFGKVVEGMDVADKIAAAPRDARDNPLEKIVIKKVVVIE
ncbi:MAG: peptidylprolyl isomerase [Bacteroidota bacterium]|jgi:cyclophilin family peptidyl-prolyl cis-trans isomerase